MTSIDNSALNTTENLRAAAGYINEAESALDGTDDGRTLAAVYAQLAQAHAIAAVACATRDAGQRF